MTLFDHRLPQPDPRTCGAAVLVVERMLRDPAYAALVLEGRHPVTGGLQPGGVADRFATESLAMHRRTTGPVDLGGSLQLPWPRALGTPPWAVDRQLTASRGRPHRTRFVAPWRRAEVLERIRDGARAGDPVPVYVGNRVLPRHVVLVLDEELTIYEPSRGTRLRMDADAFVEGRLELAGWSTPWCAVLPDGTAG